MASHSYWYYEAYFRGSKTLRNRINVNAHGYIGINDIQKAYNISPTILKGHLYCPGCKRAKLFCAKFDVNNKYSKVYLKRCPSSSHIPNCTFDKHHSYSPKTRLHEKIGKITSNNLKNLKDEALKKINTMINQHKRINHGNDGIRGEEGPYSHNNNINKSSKVNTTYRFLNWNHKFKTSDNGKDCILYGLVTNIVINHKSQNYIDRRSKKEKRAYKTIIDIRNGKRHRKIYGINWKKDGKLANNKKPDVFKGNIKLVAMCTVNYPYRDLKHIKGSFYHKRIK